ncbi:MAG: hypothetical protein JNN07_28790 [Verrucomicrobiales bacterium]|nr:hypothetical protein [Verrucomicrobiales bacterium]
MKLSELKQHLAANPTANLRFSLPNGDLVEAHAHVTEVARIDKRFVDCGGTLRNDSFCRLQTWVANDLDHRLPASKLLSILNKAQSILATEDIEVDVEHEAGLISQYPLAAVEVEGSELVFKLTRRHTACLAEDRCLPKKPRPSLNDFKPLPRFS